MKSSELRKQSAAQLQSLAETKKAEIAELLVKRRTEDFKQWHQLGSLRKDIARALTIKREAELVATDTDGETN